MMKSKGSGWDVMDEEMNVKIVNKCSYKVLKPVGGGFEYEIRQRLSKKPSELAAIGLQRMIDMAAADCWRKCVSLSSVQITLVELRT